MRSGKLVIRMVYFVFQIVNFEFGMLELVLFAYPLKTELFVTFVTNMSFVNSRQGWVPEGKRDERASLSSFNLLLPAAFIKSQHSHLVNFILLLVL